MSNDREELKGRLWESQGGRCFIGGEEIDLELQKVEIDHIIPRARGGKDHEDNYALVCEYHNRAKSDADLRVARCMAKYERIKDRYSSKGPQRPNLGDFLHEYGGGTDEIGAQVDGTSLRYTLPRAGPDVHSSRIYTDKLCRMRHTFLELPIEYLHHDERINPRAVGARVRSLIREFLDERPQLHVALAWAHLQDGMMKVQVFDGQHKAAAQLLLGVTNLPVRIFLSPDLNVLLETNTNAGTVLRQIAFDKATQRLLGSRIYWEKVDQFRAATGRSDDDLDFSEQDLLGFFKGEHREMKRYILDDVRTAVIHDPDNELKDYIEFAGRATDKPLSYAAVDRTAFSMFINKKPLSVPLNHKLEIGGNPRQLEKEQLVRLLNIIAEEIFIGKYDFDIGARRVEERVRKEEEIPDDHLRVLRMSREEVLYNWLRYVRDLIRRYFLMQGQVVEEDELFQRQFPDDLWKLARTLVRSIAALPLWVNRPLSATVFGAKQSRDYWKVAFETGGSIEGQQILAKPLNLDDLIEE